MKNFIMREIKEESDDGSMSVSRMRNTNGYASIIIMVGDKSITFDNRIDGDEYQQKAFTLANMIDTICMDSCKLPEVEYE